jgi:hypothetical protein
VMGGGEPVLHDRLSAALVPGQEVDHAGSSDRLVSL